MSVPHVYSLTHLTGRDVSSQRRVVIQGFDVPWRSFVVASLALIPALFLTAVAWLFVGQYALLMIGVVEVAAFWLIEARSSKGLKLRNYQSLLDRRRSVDGRWFICGREFDPSKTVLGTARTGSVPVLRGDPTARLDAALTGERFIFPEGDPMPGHRRAHTQRSGTGRRVRQSQPAEVTEVSEPAVVLDGWDDPFFEDPAADLAARVAASHQPRGPLT